MTHRAHAGSGAEHAAMETGRPPAIGAKGAVACPHYLASQAGLWALQHGGHAVDAAVTMNATLAVVYPHMAGLGGDMFCQVFDRGRGEVEALNGSGRAGRDVNRGFYRDKGMDEIPQRGPLAAITVPGAVHAWKTLHDRYGHLEWPRLFEAAIAYAEEGFPVSERFRDYIASYSDTIARFEETARTYMPGGGTPKTGEVLRQPDLGRSLRLIAEGGAEAFYRGEVADRICDALAEAGGLLRREDFAEHRSDWVEPLSATYRGVTVTELPPNTQGVATLLMLNLLERFDVAGIGDGSPDYIHLMTEAAKVAFSDRDEWVSDPDVLDAPLGLLLSKDYAGDRAGLVDMGRARPEEEISPLRPAMAGMGGDTTYMCAVDGEGNVCSLIESVYHEFGSAFMPAGTGILMQNRGSFFKLDPDHPVALEPGKRPFHTIIPAMALKDGEPFMAFGAMGGEGQPQTQCAMVTRIVDFGYDVQQAIEAPRWLYGRTWGAESKTLKLEGRVPDHVGTELKRRGHEVEYLEDFSQTMGHAQAILIDPDTGTYHAGADPRGDGQAMVW
ncbi:MAG: gamma-glutamyltransferase [Coriobacteriia bacterium]|nr:gamma-glutamyltransferase [Coriobacteriia bacterium]